MVFVSFVWKLAHGTGLKCRLCFVQAGVPARHAEHMLSNWANPDYDTALILTAMTGNITSPYATHIREFMQEYTTATGQISCVPDPTAECTCQSADGGSDHIETMLAFLKVHSCVLLGVHDLIFSIRSGAAQVLRGWHSQNGHA